MKEKITNTIKQHISSFEIDNELPLEDVENFFSTLDKEFSRQYDYGEIPCEIEVSATLHKWVEDSDCSMTEACADDWDDAEHLVVFMCIKRFRPRKDKKLHEEIIKACMPIFKEIIPMEHFVSVEAEDVEDFEWIIGQDKFYESICNYNFMKKNYYDNHKSFLKNS